MALIGQAGNYRIRPSRKPEKRDYRLSGPPEALKASVDQFSFVYEVPVNGKSLYYALDVTREEVGSLGKVITARFASASDIRRINAWRNGSYGINP